MWYRHVLPSYECKLICFCGSGYSQWTASITKACQISIQRIWFYNEFQNRVPIFTKLIIHINISNKLKDHSNKILYTDLSNNTLILCRRRNAEKFVAPLTLYKVKYNFKIPIYPILNCPRHDSPPIHAKTTKFEQRCKRALLWSYCLFIYSFIHLFIYSFSSLFIFFR